MVASILHVGGQAVLHRCVDREHIELVDLAELGRQRRRCGHKADLPARHMVGLAKARHDEAAQRQFWQACDALVRLSIEHHVLVDLVGDDEDVGVAQQLGQGSHLRFAPDRGARVVRRVDDDGARARRDRGPDAREVGRETAGRQRHMHGHTAGQHDVRLVAVIAGVEHDDFVARLHHGKDDGQDRLRRTGGDRDLVARIKALPVQGFDLRRHGLAQRRHAGHRRVLVQAAAHGRVHRVDQARVAIEIREALAEVHRVVLLRERGHDGEDRRAHGGQTAGERRGVQAGHG